MLTRLLPSVCSQMKKRVFIGIAWGTSAGKTMVAQSIAAKLNPIDVVVIQQDSYYKNRSHLPEEERESINYDHPSAFDTNLLIDHLRKLKNSVSIEKPNYDFSTHSRKRETEVVHPARVIILEGILVLENKKLRDSMDIKVFVDADSDVEFIRRLQRDIKETGRILESGIRQYLETVRPMHFKFVEKSEKYAYIIIAGQGNNQQAIDTIVTQIKSVLNADL